MRSKIKLRPLSAEEEQTIRKLAKSKKSPAELVRRARLVVLLIDRPELSPAQAGKAMGFTSFEAGRRWVERFNEMGIPGLQDRVRTGRPGLHSPEVREALFLLAKTPPRSLLLPYNRWTLERLQQAFLQYHGVTLSTSTIWKWIEGKGERWRQRHKWAVKNQEEKPDKQDTF